MKTRMSLDPQRTILDTTVEISPDAVKVSELREKVGELAGITARGVLNTFQKETDLSHLYVLKTSKPGIYEFDRETTDKPYRAFRFSRPKDWTSERLAEIIDRCESPQDFLDALGQGQADRFVLWTALQQGIPVITDEEPPRPIIVVSDHSIELARTLAHKGTKPKPNKAPDSSIMRAPRRNVRPANISTVASDIVTSDLPSPDGVEISNGADSPMAHMTRRFEARN